jgi:hypothetical protein
MRRPSYENAAVYHCAGAQTADIGGQAGRRADTVQVRCAYSAEDCQRTGVGGARSVSKEVAALLRCDVRLPDIARRTAEKEDGQCVMVWTWLLLWSVERV